MWEGKYMMPGRYTFEVKMDRTGSSTLRDYLEKHDFEIYRQSPVRRLEKVKGNQFKEDEDEMTIGVTYIALWNGDHPHAYYFEILEHLETHISVISYKTSFTRDISRLREEVPG